MGGDADYQPNYYYLDNVEIVLIDSTAPDESESSNSESFERATPPNASLVDLDPSTNIPSRQHLPVARGFVGDIKMELGVRLHSGQQYVLEYGKKEKIVIVCEGPQLNHFNDMAYTLEYQARKLRKKGITIYVDTVDGFEIAQLETTCKDIEPLNSPAFKGALYHCKR